MLKFLRKYQKWMLVVFCGGLMVAFLIPQAASQFAPNPATATMGTTYGGKKITREHLNRADADLQMMRRLALDPLPLPGLALLPNTGSQRDDAMMWLLIQHAAEHNKLGASDQAAFNLVASALGVEDMDALEKEAGTIGVNAAYLLDVARQYLVAEQYRQLVAGIEYTKPNAAEGQTGSPGLRRLFALNEAMLTARQMAQQYEQMGLPPNQAEGFAIQSVMTQGGYLDKVVGHTRVSSAELRYALQREFTKMDLTVVVLDAEDRLDTVTMDDAYVTSIFDRFADDAPGTGEPYGLGYREPDRVKLEALRIPIDSVREAVAKDITAEDIRKFYNERPGQYIDDSELEPGETPRPARLTAEQRDEIRLTLTQMRAEQKVIEIAQQARLRLNEDARGLQDDGPFKKLPEDFKPTPLVEVAAEIEQEHGVSPEIILVDEWVSGQDMIDSARFTQAWIAELPNSSVRMPNPQFGFLMDQPIAESVLGGRAGLFATIVPDLSDFRAGRLATLGDYVALAQPFIDADSQQANAGLQVGLPGRLLSDMTRSTYVFRLTEAQPSQPAQALEPIAKQVREDARKVKAYEDLAAEKDKLIERAVSQSIERLMVDADAKTTLTGLTRQDSRRPGGAVVEGVQSTGPILEQALILTDQWATTGGTEELTEADRTFAVELPGDYKLAVVRLDAVRPMTQRDYRQEADSGNALLLASQLDSQSEVDPPLSMEALMRYTNFKWAEGFGRESLDEDGADGEEDEDAGDDE